MLIKDDRRFMARAWVCILTAALIRLAVIPFFPLAPDETNYWQWSRHPALGYHDQAPLIAWSIALATRLFGHTEFGVRISSVLAVLIASIYIIIAARRWFGGRAALYAALMSQGILAINAGGLLATADGLQAAAWAAASYHVARAYEDDHLRHWLIGGLWFGAGMLSKYSMLLFLPCAYLYGLVSADHRRRLLGFRPYAGLLVGMFLFLPPVYWNAANGWQSFRHVAYLGGANQSVSVHWRFFGDFIASQAALVTPLVFLLVCSAWLAVWRQPHRVHSWIDRYCWFLSFPVLAVFAVLSLHTRVYGNWPMVAYVTAMVLAAAYYAPGGRLVALQRQSRGVRIWPWALATAYGMSILVVVQVVWPVFPIPLKYDRTAIEMSGWRELGQSVASLVQGMPDPQKTFIFGLRYQVASELAFYVPGQPRTLSINKWRRPNVYDYWWTDADRLGWDAVGVTFKPNDHLRRLNQVFERVEPPQVLPIYAPAVFGRIGSDQRPVKHFYIYKAYGFKGGLRWVPPDQSDIRAVSLR